MARERERAKSEEEDDLERENCDEETCSGILSGLV